MSPQESQRTVNNLQESFAIVRRSLGGEDPKTLAVMKELALAYCDNDDYARARGLLTEVLSIRSRLYGTQDPETLDTAHRFGGVLYRIGDLSGAREMQEKVLHSFRKRDGDGSNNSILGLRNLGITLIALGESQRLISVGNKIIDARLEMDRDRDKNVIPYLHWLASTWRHSCEVKRASKLYRRVILGCIRNRCRLSIMIKSICAEVLFIPAGRLALKIKPVTDTSEFQ